MKIPPLLIHPELSPVSSSRLIKRCLVSAKIWISVSFGRSLHTRPAVCQVVPLVNWDLSKRRAFTPLFVSSYKVLHPADPPPEILIELQKFVNILKSWNIITHCCSCIMVKKRYGHHLLLNKFRTKRYLIKKKKKNSYCC